MRPEPHVFVVLGATGDLTARKLLPALYELVADHEGDCIVLGAATTVQDDAAFRSAAVDALTRAGVPADRAAPWAERRVFYQPVPRDGSYDDLARRIEALEADHGLRGNRVVYLALPPAAFPETIEAVGRAGIQNGPGWTRLVVEKPFGSDLETARALNEIVHRWFAESEVYRIDHYLGKETVRNLLVFRFTNPIFESSWNRDRVERVEITVAESLGVGTRGRYYDTAGVIRDMIQSHITQLLTLVAMEAPTTFEADAVRDEKVKVLRSIRNIPEKAVVLGQYGAGVVAGKTLPEYRSLTGVAPESSTPTYAAIRVWVDNWRWQGVPFFLRTGKALARRVTEIAVTFRRPPVCLLHFEKDECIEHSNVLRLTLQPDEGFSLEIDVKQPGDMDGSRTIPLHFSYAEAFGDIPDAYETLIADVLEGDQTLFVRADEVEESWRLYSPTLDYDVPLHPYAAGTWGPEEAAALLGDGARPWETQ
jgi:glucose-6-phosphate 1-dehydrogenase